MVTTSQGHVHYRAAGVDGTAPVVLLHAAPRSSAMFVPVLERLAGDLSMIAIDCLGYGDSDHPRFRPSIPDYADNIIEVLAGLGVERCTIAGLAFGAYIASDLAVRHPQVVDRVILQSCPIYPSYDYAAWRHAFALAAFDLDDTGFPIARSLEQLLVRDVLHSPLNPTREWLDADNIDIAKAGRQFWDAMRAVASYDLAATLAKLEHRALLMWGSDFLYSKRRGEFFSLIRNYEVALLPAAGLFAQIDSPVEYDAALLQFVRDRS